MARKPKNQNLQQARREKNDEFYTQLTDIELELRHYWRYFKGKVVYCNCDDPYISSFFRYFSLQFEHLGLRWLIATCYKNQDAGQFSHNGSGPGVYLEYAGDKNGNCVPDVDEIGVRPLSGDGDFRSDESIELLKQADIVVTNPPFSLFREYVAQLVEYKKKFLIIGSLNAIKYKEIFKLIVADKLWLGYHVGNMSFVQPGVATSTPQRVCWYTNLPTRKRNEELILYKKYTPEEYPTYANYNAIEVSKTKDIPIDYNGLMGVPISFIDKYNPKQFEIIGSSGQLGQSMSEVAPKGAYVAGGPCFYLANGGGTYRRLYERLVIKRRTA